MSQTFIKSFTHLKDKPNADQALDMLKRVASLVKPIMRKHGWVLPTLSEFFPDSPNLLGLNCNMGEEILIRLRPDHAPGSFLPLGDVIGTMLHELTHNVHGPHDDKFYKFLDELKDEYDELQRSGYAGEGFFSEGKRLGGNMPHNLPPHIARQKALEAAEKRRQHSHVLGSGGGRRLGGPSRNAGLTPKELAARAAEQRRKDENSCASGAEARREAEKAAKESVENKVIDLTLSDDNMHTGSGSDSDVVIVEDRSAPVASKGPRRVSSTGTPITKGKTSGAVTSGRTGPSGPSTSRPGGSLDQRKLPAAEWSCPACTLLNPETALQCDACEMRKPLDEREGWSCLYCGESGMPVDYWTCRFCGEVKSHS